VTWRWRRAVLACFVVGACASCDTPYGAYGVVRGPSGEAVSEASVTLESLSGDVLKRAVSDREGTYRVGGMSWVRMQTRLTVRKPGYRRFVKELPAGQTTHLVVTLDSE
jgi:hypothetical protein